MKKYCLVLLTVMCLVMVLSGCVTINNGVPENAEEVSEQDEATDELTEGTDGDVNEDKKDETGGNSFDDKSDSSGDNQSDDKSDEEKADDKTNNSASSSSKNSDELNAEDIFEVRTKPLYMEGTLTENDTTVSALLYITEQHLRAEMHDYEIEPIAVINLEDDSAFAYCESKKIGLEYDDVGVYEFLHYQDFIDENAGFVENMEETTMNGYDVVYGEVSHEGDIMKFYYSCEYDVPIKIELTTVEGNYSAMNVTTVEILNDADPSYSKSQKALCL